MSISVKIPEPLRKYTNSDKVFIEATSIDDLIEQLEIKYPGIKKHICDDVGIKHRFVNIYRNNSDIRFLHDKRTLLKEGDEVSIVPAFSGGNNKWKH